VRPETRYAKTTDGVHLAYQVVGEGSIDIIFVIGWTTNVEALWEEPSLARFLARLASISRLIVFDKRGVGLSDRVPEAALPTLETRMDDVRAVMEAAGSERAVVLGVSEGGPLSILFAATYPERTIALILFGTMARFAWAPDFPWGVTEEKARDVLDVDERTPRRAVALNQDVASRESDRDQIVHHHIGAQSGRNTIRGGIAQKRWTEIIVCELGHVALKEHLRHPVRGDRVECGLFSKHLIASNPIKAA